MNCDNIASKKF